MMSEFIGTGSTIGTAQTAYSTGISAAWNLITLALAFALFAYTMAKSFMNGESIQSREPLLKRMGMVHEL